MGNEENDVPADAPEYGIAGWEENDKSLLVYDRYDIWSIDPATGKAVNFTNGVGRKEKIIFRYQNTDPEQKFIPSKKMLWLILPKTMKTNSGAITKSDGKCRATTTGDKWRP